MRERVQDMAEYCSIEVAMTVLGGRWKLVILKYLLEGTHRFGQLKRALPDITARMLTRQLRELEEDGLVQRTVYAEVPPKVEYSVTAVGKSLAPIAQQLQQWGTWYRDSLRETSPGPHLLESDTRRCGH
jgi:DNA-binding HxlR family transcriptional regulator